MEVRAEELRAVLAAYKTVMDACSPALHPTMAQRSAQWATASDTALRTELAEYLREASRPTVGVRVFWKLGAELRYGGCNEQLARDAGMPNGAAMVGLDDFDKRLPWRSQAPKYRKDDKAVVASGKASLDIIERQESAPGKVIWLRTGKAPIRAATGQVIGIFAMYEVLDEAAGLSALAARNRRVS